MRDNASSTSLFALKKSSARCSSLSGTAFAMHLNPFTLPEVSRSISCRNTIRKASSFLLLFTKMSTCSPGYNSDLQPKRNRTRISYFSAPLWRFREPSSAMIL
ncbi:hypothetical protein TraAM80_01178 [Trypanosoma rangeli]|uniref:Uncharacterized protein n=1 Tax=Trypanosoma rangeli TaxID=5698 RepID=A0A3R7NSS3_TRYRA|nr:uncharacterized protein TraAM80_01178 [Trypanosoma rangeli]RNF11051.1 hypothetical protein TraAM80_01178 [Trypanosoma rangeli]|eukprot:RNF11051.1 hypothetical protein TraAM80_01178 [Trypanosoma rangeli]